MIFVFGSNLAGRHGKGAALTAMRQYGARYGVGEGRTGNAYAIPTKDGRLQPLALSEIAMSLRRFAGYAASLPMETFLLTPIGCGLAGNDPREIAAIVQRANMPPNVVLADTWADHLPADLVEALKAREFAA